MRSMRAQQSPPGEGRAYPFMRRAVRCRTNAVRKRTVARGVRGGPSRNRTGVQGFAVLCVTTPPSGPDARGAFVASEPRWSRAKSGAGDEKPQSPTYVRHSINGSWRFAPLPIRANLKLHCIIGIEQL